MSDNSGIEKEITSDGEAKSTPQEHVHDGRVESKQPKPGHVHKTAPRNVGKQKVKHVQTPLPHAYETGRSSKKSTVLYVVVGACILLVGGGALYVSSLAKTPWTPVPEPVGSFESTPVSQSAPSPVIEEPEPIAATSTVKTSEKNLQPIITPNAIIDVPGVGLRNTPDIAGKTMSNSLKLGEHVEIVKKVSGKGPSWVRIKTKSGKIGWVFSSVVKELKRG